MFGLSGGLESMESPTFGLLAIPNEKGQKQMAET